MGIKDIRVLKFLTPVGVAAIVIAYIFSGSGVFADPAIFTVVNTDDSGPGSLRQAITDANTNNNPDDMDIIGFAIAGTGVHTINLASDLPEITEKVTINGYSQSGSSENGAINPQPFNNVIKIELSGTDGTFTTGALSVVAPDSVIKGLAVYDSAIADPSFEKSNIRLAAEGTKVQGSYVGLRADGSTVGTYGKNSVSINADAGNITIGGTNPSERNVISSASSIAQSAAIGAAGSGTQVIGNYIGLAPDGVTDLSPGISDANGLAAPFAMGVNILGDTGGVTIGGSTVAHRNVITGNTVGVVISSTNSKIQGNYIGTDYAGVVRNNITNGMGVTAVAASDSLIGGINPGEGNLIAGVKGSGIEVARMTIPAYEYILNPVKIAALGNSIHSVTPFNLMGVGESNLGLDLSVFNDSNSDFTPDEFTERGPSLNDDTDADSGPNGFINAPVIKSAKQVGDQLTITYDLDVADSPSNTYRVEFYANDERTIFGYGPGEIYLGAATDLSPGTNKTITLTVADSFYRKSLSATTTAIDGTTASGYGSTSEFSLNISIASESDTDADNITDVVENAAPNSGDGNSDGIADSVQPTVSSLKDFDQNHWITFVTEGCSENSSVSSLSLTDMNSKDNGYEYPFGLTDFTLNCSRGNTVSVTKYIFVNNNPSEFVVRKYDPVSETFKELPGSALSTVTSGSTRALKLTYSIQDGGPLDDDRTANGTIVDPVGIARESTTLAATGMYALPLVVVALLLISFGIYTITDYRRHKKMLIVSFPEMHSKYTYWHHLKVVTIPLLSYRLKIVVEKKSTHSITPVSQ